MSHRDFVIGAIAAAATASGAFASSSPLSNWNLITRSYVTSSSEVDGSALIGGYLDGGASNYAIHGLTDAGGVGLAVGGNINGGPKSVNAGSLRYGGSLNTIVNMNGGGMLITDNTVASQAAAAMNTVSGISMFLAGLSANSTMDGGGNLNATPTLIDGQLVAVFNISAASVQSLGQLNLHIGTAQSVIINMPSAGGLVDLQGAPNIIGDFSKANSSRILWNFFDASSVLVNNSFRGALVAPNAALQVLGGGIDGSVAVDRITAQNAEIRSSVYTGYIPAPGAASLCVLAGAVAARRRREPVGR